MMLYSPNQMEQSLNSSNILFPCSKLAEIPSFFYPSAVLVMRCHQYLQSFVFVLNYYLSSRSMAEEYVMVLGVVETGTIVLVMTVVIDLITAMMRLLRTTEAMN